VPAGPGAASVPGWPRRVLGIDPGLAATGYGVIEGDGSNPVIVACGVVRTRPKDTRANRLFAIHRRIAELIEEYRPTEVAIEQQYVAENVRSAMSIGEVRAAAMLAGATAGLPVFEYQPAAIKEAVVGHGGAPKEQVRQMVMLQLGLTEPPEPLDVSDALAIALTRLAEARMDEVLARSGVPARW
jgi:crossover junction endodeoxyribonuclease RuvC